MLGSSAQAHDNCYDGYKRHYRGDRYEYRETVHYERPYYRSYYYEDRPVVVRRRVIVDDCAPYSYRPHHSGIRFFFGF